MKTKKIVAMLLAAAMAAASLAACNKNPIGDTQIGDSENKPGDTKTPSAEGGLTLEEISKQIEAKVGKQLESGRSTQARQQE